MTVHTQNKSVLNADLAEAHQPQCTRRPDQIHQKLLQLINGLTKTVELSEHAVRCGCENKHYGELQLKITSIYLYGIQL